MSALEIVRVGGSEPVVFAARELSRGLQRATGKRLPVRTKAGRGPALTVGLAADLGIAAPAGLHIEDDWIHIAPQRGGYVLAGSNPRSVLFAVYRYLRAAGFRWLRPGRRGELLPRLTSPLVRGLRVEETAACRYRTICIEGGCSREHILDLVDWMAKNGMNGYFVQFKLGGEFFRRWYEHRDNPVRSGAPISDAKLKKMVAEIIAAVHRRGMRFEHVGHGWTCAALGVEGEGWGKKPIELTPAQRKWLARLDGKRDFWNGIPLSTQLDYTNPAARAAMSDAIVAYARQHREVDLLHVWLADGLNNHDENSVHDGLLPSDHYVELLNDLDCKLTAAGLPQRIVFIAYVDMLWAPARARIRNPTRFVLAFAPITRTYRTTLGAVESQLERIKPFTLNHNVIPLTPQGNVRLFKGWRRAFAGDAFDFDYHGIWACYFEPGMMFISRILHQDIRELREAGLQGLNSCQVQRLSFPHNLLMDTLARAQWDGQISSQQLARESFSDAFGPLGAEVLKQLQTISRLWQPMFEPIYIPKPDAARITASRRNWKRIEGWIAGFRSVADRGMRRKQPEAQAWSWRYLVAFAECLEHLAPVFRAYVNCDPVIRQHLNRWEQWIWRQEPRLHPVLDVQMMVSVLRWRAKEVEDHLSGKPRAHPDFPVTIPAPE